VFYYQVISGFDFAHSVFKLLRLHGAFTTDFEDRTQHFGVCCMKRYLKRNILVHHGLNDKTRIVSGTAYQQCWLILVTLSPF
jgi:hypothetical protein